MTIRLSSKLDSSAFTPLLTSGLQTITSGASGTMVTLSPPSGQKVRLTALGMVATTTETGITVQVNSVDAVDSKVLVGTNATTANGFLIAPGIPNGIGASEVGSAYPPIVGGIDEDITIIKDTGSTAADIIYGYQFGE